MKDLIIKNRLYIAEAVAGFLYWKYVGCITGKCTIKANPLSSAIYFPIFGSLLFGIFSKQSASTKNNL